MHEFLWGGLMGELGDFPIFQVFTPINKKEASLPPKIACPIKLVLSCRILHTVFVPMFVIRILALIRQCIVLA